MKKRTLFVFSLLSTIAVSAQEVLSTQGDSYSNATANINFTIGEIVINTGTNGINDLTQGFHQTNWNLVGMENHSPSYEATIYPNPVSEVLNIKTSAFENVTYRLYDTTGKLMLQDKLSAEQTSIEVGQLAPGSYSIILNNYRRNLKTFKLIKTQ